MSENYRPYLETLDAICRVSYGYVSEYFDQVGARLFHKNFDHVLAYIYKENSRFTSAFEKMLIEAIGVELSESKDRSGAQAKITAFLRKKEQALNGPQRAYIEGLKAKMFAYRED